jgi:hypothetical protein
MRFVLAALLIFGAIASATVLVGQRVTRVCFSRGISDQTLIGHCSVRPGWVVPAVAAILVTVVPLVIVLIARRFKLLLVLSAAVGIPALVIGVGALFVHWFSPPPTAENSSPPPEPFYFLEGAAVGIILVVAIAATVVLFRRRSSVPSARSGALSE